MLTGRYEHNNRVSSLAGGGCMHMNSSRVDNPDFWTTSHVVRLHKLGYTTGGYTTPPPCSHVGVCRRPQTAAAVRVTHRSANINTHVSVGHQTD